MSATSGIGVSDELSSAFAEAVTSRNVRFLKISIRNETLVPDSTVAPSGKLEDDLKQLQNLLEESIPAYMLVRLDDPPSSWLAVHYVPDSAKVRDKMLYASTRNSLTKSLGSTHFSDTIFATSRDDITPEAYAAHRRHLAAPKPMSAREKEMAEVKEAERQAGGTAYQGSRARSSPFGTGVGLSWSDEVKSAVEALAEASEDRLVTLSIDPSSESLVILENGESSVDQLKTKIPASEPSYTFFSWSAGALQRRIIFIYSCPSSSPVKHRMLYSSGSSSVYQNAKTLLPQLLLAARKVETSNPDELDAAYLEAELGHSNEPSRVSTPNVAAEGFARPRGPARRR
ncbi:actin depolymerizing protein [Auriscalpium vulgare]|uniref:Actin depolymerizing protein n=1 Tax=Auriscalpium vulgare TaxID=40419 RepID=A0ACB8SC43_9AGAM|nr:actin depolymerizing protein [Auriscalpium vulgare]